MDLAFESTPCTDDYLSWRVPDLLGQFGDVELPRRPRCAETIAGELTGYCLERNVGLSALLTAVGMRPSPGACGVLTAAAQMAFGSERIELGRRAAQMRGRLGRMEWLDHIAAAEPTGRASREDTFDGVVAWMIELDDGLDRYCLVTASDLRRNTLAWVYPGRSLDKEADGALAADRALRDASLEEAIIGVREALARPAMSGVTTTDEPFGTWARWRLWQLERPDLTGPEEVPWSDLAAKRNPHSPLRAVDGR